MPYATPATHDRRPAPFGRGDACAWTPNVLADSMSARAPRVALAGRPRFVRDSIDRTSAGMGREPRAT